MNTPQIAAVTLGLAFALAGTASGQFAGGQNYSIQGPNSLDRELGIERGKLRLLKGAASGRDWTFRQRPEDREAPASDTRRWRGEIRGTDSPNWRRGWRLAFDPTGKDKTVGLSGQPTPGTVWAMDEVKKYSDEWTIRATAGPFAGWYLDRGDKAEQYRDVEGKPYTGYKLILVEKPRKLPIFKTIDIAP